MFKSFVDLLFILLCGTIVSLSQSLQLGALETAPAKVGSGGISEVRADQVDVLVVNESDYQLVLGSGTEPIEVVSLDQLDSYLQNTRCLVIVAGTDVISHQRVMDCWDHGRTLGIKVQLGVDKKEPNQGVL